MQQLYFVKKEKLEWRDVAKPVISKSCQALVRPFAVAKCDLDDAFLFHNLDVKMVIGKMLGLIDPYYFTDLKNLLKGPFPFGHECVAEVIEIGDDVKKIKVGDVVSVPFQISCGTCNTCKEGLSNVCETVPPVTTYGFGKHLEWGGAMSDFILVPFADHMLLPIPRNLDPLHLASLSDNVPDAYRHVEMLEDNPEQSLLIISGKAKSVGIYTILLAKALGAREVEYVDYNAERRQLALNCGADRVYASFSEIKKKYDITVDASSTDKGLIKAIELVKNFGTVSSSGIYIKKTFFPLIHMYTKGVTFKIGLANARKDAEKALNLIQKSMVPLEKVTSKCCTWDNAIEGLLTDTTKVIVTRPRLSK